MTIVAPDVGRGCCHSRQSTSFVNAYTLLVQHVVYPSTDVAFKQRNSLQSCASCGDSPAMLALCLHCVHAACLTEHFHAHSTETGHMFGILISTGAPYCVSCGDVIYDMQLEKVRRRAENEYRRFMHFSLSNSWAPTDASIGRLVQADNVIAVHKDYTLGLRGLLNLGNTCFMNCILQAMAHTPLLREYFLSDQHLCTSSTDDCLMCMVGQIFQEFYGARPDGLFISHKMLYLVWTHARHLAGYEQQDAHEFFIATLDVLHKHSNSSSNASHQCQCIVDRIFSGRLQSDVTCQACGDVRTTLDPCWDISLDMHSNDLTLANCLEHYARVEHLGHSSKISCETCDTFVAFPLHLDVGQYMASEVRHPSPNMYKYCLYAVVVHEGGMDSGHYICYVRRGTSDWYRCDDHIITASSEAHVLQLQAYLLFYHKTHIYYE